MGSAPARTCPLPPCAKKGLFLLLFPSLPHGLIPDHDIREEPPLPTDAVVASVSDRRSQLGASQTPVPAHRGRLTSYAGAARAEGAKNAECMEYAQDHRTALHVLRNSRRREKKKVFHWRVLHC